MARSRGSARPPGRHGAVAPARRRLRTPAPPRRRRARGRRARRSPGRRGRGPSPRCPIEPPERRAPSRTEAGPASRRLGPSRCGPNAPHGGERSRAGPSLHPSNGAVPPVALARRTRRAHLFVAKRPTALPPKETTHDHPRPTRRAPSPGARARSGLRRRPGPDHRERRGRRPPDGDRRRDARARGRGDAAGAHRREPARGEGHRRGLRARTTPPS